MICVWIESEGQGRATCLKGQTDKLLLIPFEFPHKALAHALQGLHMQQ